MKITFNDFMNNNQTKYKSFSLKATDIIKLSNRSRYTSKIANSALKAEVIPYPEFDSFTLKSSKDWETRNEKYGRTYQLYIHSLRFVNELLLNYQSTRDSKYIKKADYYIDEWFKYALKNNKNKMIWYDHAVAQRTQVLIYFIYLNNNNKQFDYNKYGKILEYHGLYLAEYAKYNRTNHGLMMDRSLMLLGILFENNNLFNVGYYRSIDTFWYSFSSKGVHLENSPGYHKMVVKMYKQIEMFLNSNDRSYGEIVNNRLKQAESIQDLITLPTGFLPTIGDTRNKIEVEKTNYNNLHDNESGITIIQNEINKLYFSFISGYSSITHKHFDDLSITYMYKGESFLVDPGLFNYTKNPYRKYIKSAQAHSSLSIINKSYELSSENKFNRNIRTEYYKETDTIIHVKGINEDYELSTLSRHIIFLKNENVFIIIDEIITEKNIDIMHNFNLHENVKVRKEENGYNFENNGINIKLKSFSENDFSEIIEGNTNSEHIIAINSTNFNEVKTTNQVRYMNNINDKNSVRKIFGLYDAKIKDFIVSTKEDLLLIDINNKEYYINL